MISRRTIPGRPRARTITGQAITMPPPIKYPIRISPDYLRELRARVEAIGTSAVASAAGLGRITVWRQITGGEGRRATPDAIERIRRAVLKLEPSGAPLPPPIVSVRGQAHHEWIALADGLDADELREATAEAARRLKRRK